jgi:fructose-bisphosphate aldolase, class II
MFHRFVEVETAEIHLATGFQNLLIDHPAFPAELRRGMDEWCFGNAADERQPDETEQQFVYKTRKKTIGPFKRELWELATKDEILAAQRAKIDFLYRELAVDGSRSMVDRYITPVPVHRPLPDALREGVVTG